jgi:hypothetical protein
MAAFGLRRKNRRSPRISRLVMVFASVVEAVSAPELADT